MQFFNVSIAIETEDADFTVGDTVLFMNPCNISGMIHAFVDSIIIHGKYEYEIKLVYDDQFADLQKLKKEKEAQSR